MFSTQTSHKKIKRETIRDAVIETEADDTEAANNELVETAAAGFDDVIENWKGLLPSAVGCFTSVAGK